MKLISILKCNLFRLVILFLSFTVCTFVIYLFRSAGYVIFYIMILPIVLSGLFFRVHGGIIGGILGNIITSFMYHTVFPQFESYNLIFELADSFLIMHPGILAGIMSSKIHKDKKLLKEQNILINELEHRVKNNLQLFVSLLRMQKRRAVNETEKNNYENLINRVLALSHVYSRIYITDSAYNINFKEYIDKLIKNTICGFENSKVSYELEIEDITVNPKKLQTLTIILNELVINSIKHADVLPGDLKITVKLYADENDTVLEVKDNGKKAQISESGSGLGLQIVKQLTEINLSGTFSFSSSNNGFLSNIKFKSA